MPHRLTDRENQPGGETFEGPLPNPGGSDSGLGDLLGKFAGQAAEGGGDAAIVALLGAIPVVGGFVAAGYMIFKTAAALWPTPDKGKEFAAALQQAMERGAVDIARQVERGNMDPDAALVALHLMSGSASSLRGDSDDKGNLTRAGRMANIIITQNIARIRTLRTQSLFQPFENAESERRGLTNTREAHGTPEFQRDRLRTGLTDFFTGGLKGETGGIGDSLRSEGGSQGDSPSFAELAIRNFNPASQDKIDAASEAAKRIIPGRPDARQEEFDNLGSIFRKKFDSQRLA